jgi:predicted RNase H-like HicB family nuclease
MSMCRHIEEHLAAGAVTRGDVMRYAEVVEKGPTSFGAYVPDLPGCVAVADNLDEARRIIAEAIQVHLEGLREDGEPIPEPSSLCEDVDA